MEPFEISLTFIRVQGEEKKKMAREFFSSALKRKVRGNSKSRSAVKSLSVSLLISFGFYLVCVFWAGLWGFSQTIYVREGRLCFFFLFCPLWHFSLAATRDSRLVFVFFGMAELSSLSPPHWARVFALWRQVDVTKYGAICSTVMHHRLTAYIKSALWSVHPRMHSCTFAPRVYFTPVMRSLVSVSASTY